MKIMGVGEPLPCSYSCTNATTDGRSTEIEACLQVRKAAAHDSVSWLFTTFDLGLTFLARSITSPYVTGAQGSGSV